MLIIFIMDMYESAWKNIVQPTQIKTKKHLLGPSERHIDECKIVRKDLEVMNRNNKKLSGYIFYAPESNFTETVLYLHGNGGTKI